MRPWRPWRSFSFWTFAVTLGVLLFAGTVFGWEGDDGALSQREAERGVQMQLTEPPAPPVILGILGRPVAPFWLDNCDEMRFYREQWRLPSFFDGIGWRESNCRNEDGVHTGCCHGYWQLHENHPINSGYARRMRDECRVFSYLDFNSDNPDDKQRQACAAAVMYQISGTTPWRQTR